MNLDSVARNDRRGCCREGGYHEKTVIRYPCTRHALHDDPVECTRLRSIHRVRAESKLQAPRLQLHKRGQPLADVGRHLQQRM